jgi:hypothetical protein
MTKERRPRGRPKGTGKDDSVAMNRIAELLVANPSLKPTTAIKRIGIRNESDVRRLQVKWKAQGPALLDAARMRQKQVTQAGPMGEGFRGFLAAASEIQAQVEAFRRASEGPLAEFLRQSKMIRRHYRGMHKFVKQMDEQQRMLRQAINPLGKFRNL